MQLCELEEHEPTEKQAWTSPARHLDMLTDNRQHVGLKLLTITNLGAVSIRHLCAMLRYSFGRVLGRQLQVRGYAVSVAVARGARTPRTRWTGVRYTEKGNEEKKKKKKSAYNTSAFVWTKLSETPCLHLILASPISKTASFS